jgi:polyisoprenoid-binding protein YceI
MKKIFLASVIGLLTSVSLVSTGTQPMDNPVSEHKVNINLDDSKIQCTGNKVEGEQAESAKFTGGELVIDDNELVGGSFTIALNSISSTDSKAHFEIKKVTKLPVTRTEQGDIKFTHKIEGELTIKGQTKPISFDASINMLKGKIAASSEIFRIDRNTSLKLELVTD